MHGLATHQTRVSLISEFVTTYWCFNTQTEGSRTSEPTTRLIGSVLHKQTLWILQNNAI